MWHAIGILLIGAQDPAVVGADEYRPDGAALGPQPEQRGGSASGPPAGPGFPSGLIPGEQPMHAAEAAAGYDPGYCESGNSFVRPCSFDSYWDFTGQRSPTDYAGVLGYGPDWCNTWNARVEWLMWFSRGRQATPLISTFDAIVAGSVVGANTVYGNEPIGERLRHGARITLGRYLADSDVRAEGRFWGLEDGSEQFVIASSDNPHIGRPLINAQTGVPTVFSISNVAISAPNTFANGVIDVLSKNDLFGADAWLRRTWWDDGQFRLDVLGGYQFTRLDDSLRIQTDSTSLADGTRYQDSDLFAARNEFHGGSIGLVGDWRKNALSLEVLGKIAFGNQSERVIIDGQTIVTPTAGAVQVFPRSVLATTSNIGEYRRNTFAVIPELNANVIVHISPAWRLTAGYSLLYWSEAVLAGQQIDRRVNLTQIPPSVPAGVALPTYLGRETTYLVQGMNLGIDYRW
jgi:Putative beta barrel porin-7 (BBP7)